MQRTDISSADTYLYCSAELTPHIHILQRQPSSDRQQELNVYKKKKRIMRHHCRFLVESTAASFVFTLVFAQPSCKHSQRCVPQGVTLLLPWDTRKECQKEREKREIKI